uniref:CSON005681 protein n=1 Tax=Culicoides sonorensis TaxID=179676 RepID=A0A336LVF5_CULSO
MASLQVTPRFIKPTTSDAPNDLKLVKCSHCSRTFFEDRIKKHEGICKKTHLPGAKTSLTPKKLPGTKPHTSSTATSNPKPFKSNWRQNHEEFIKAIRAAKKVQEHLKSGGNLRDLPPPEPSQNPDYIQCPHCLRSFNQSAAERHIPKCAHYEHNKPRNVSTVKNSRGTTNSVMTSVANKILNQKGKTGNRNNGSK